MIYTHAAAALVAATLAAAGVWQVQAWRYTGQIAAMETERSRAVSRSLERRMGREHDLQISADRTRKDKANELAALRTHHAADLERMRQRPARPDSAELPAPTGDGPPASGCTGAQLYREDAELALGESLRADIIRDELQACYAQYDRARAEINRD